MLQDATPIGAPCYVDVSFSLSFSVRGGVKWRHYGDFTMSTIKRLDIDAFPKGEISETHVHIVSNGIGEPIRVPHLVRGS